MSCQARIRYQGELFPVTASKKNNYYQVKFKKNPRAITGGQSVVFYFKEELLGGGIIK
ncbi:MAG: aminomethyltransferase beta-barrel domain-containing protein [Patescibacteria group bacterium]